MHMHTCPASCRPVLTYGDRSVYTYINVKARRERVVRARVALLPCGCNSLMQVGKPMATSVAHQPAGGGTSQRFPQVAGVRLDSHVRL